MLCNILIPSSFDNFVQKLPSFKKKYTIHFNKLRFIADNAFVSPWVQKLLAVSKKQRNSDRDSFRDHFTCILFDILLSELILKLTYFKIDELVGVSVTLVNN